jgi:hypothetical protein
LLLQAFRLTKRGDDVICNFKHRSATRNEELKCWGGMRTAFKDKKKGIHISTMNPPQVILKKNEHGRWPDFAAIPYCVRQSLGETKLAAMTKYLTNPEIRERIKRKEPRRYQEFWASLQEDLQKSQVIMHAIDICTLYLS